MERKQNFQGRVIRIICARDLSLLLRAKTIFNYLIYVKKPLPAPWFDRLKPHGQGEDPSTAIVHYPSEMAKKIIKKLW